MIAIAGALIISRLAHASPIEANFGVKGAGTYLYIDSQSASFDFLPPDAFVTASGSTISPYFTPGQSITFTQGPYSLGPVGTVFTPAIPLPLATSTENGETLSFSITDYTADFIGTAGAIVTGGGYFTETGTVNYAQTAGEFSLGPYAASSSAGFTANFHTVASDVTPEPNSLILLGTGLVSMVGAFRRRRA